MKKTLSENTVLNFICDNPQLTIEAAQPAHNNGKAKNRRFNMVAYTGGMMHVGGWYDPVVVDLKGLTISAQAKPIFLGHEQDIDCLIGQTDSIKIASNQLIATGDILGESDEVKKVLALADKGFKWQASIGARAEKSEVLAEGQAAKVNGREVAGPATVVRKATLGEISFVMLGADQNTEVLVASGKKNKYSDFDRSISMSQNVTEIKTAERDRIAKIEAMCSGLAGEEVLDLKAKAINEEISISDLQAGLLDESKRQNQLKAIEAKLVPHGYVKQDRRGAEDAQVLEAAFLLHINPAVAMKNFSPDILEMAAACKINSIGKLMEAALTFEGRPLPTTSKELIKGGFSTVSMPKLLGGGLQKLIMDAFHQASQTWRLFGKIRPLNDYKSTNVLRPNYNINLDELGDTGEVKSGRIQEDEFSALKIGTYSKLLRFGYQAAVNDDMSVFSDIPAGMGAAAARKVSDLVWGIILANAGSFFNASPTGYAANYVAGTTTALSVDSLGVAYLKMRKQTDSNGQVIDLMPRCIAVPPELEVTARAILNSQLLQRYVSSSADNLATGNPFANMKELTLAVESRLSNALYTGYSTAAWYLFAGPQDAPVNVGFLGGNESPNIEYFSPASEADYLAHAWRVTLDFGASLGDPRAAVKMKGVA
jgi:hypothetical protein